MSNEKVYRFSLQDARKGETHQIKFPPTVHIARGFSRRLPILRTGRPLICISDWQFETPTQEHFWEQAYNILVSQLGGDEDLLSRAIVLVAGDMASCSNTLLGSASDAAPNLHWLHKTFNQGDIFTIYGNHCLPDSSHLKLSNSASGLPCLLPNGQSISVPLAGTDDNQYQLLSDTEIDDLVDTFQSHSKSNHKNGSVARPKKPKIPHGLTKQQRAAYCANLKFEKAPRQKSQWSHQNPEQAAVVEAMKAIHNRILAAPNSAEQSSSADSEIEKVRIGAVHGIPAARGMGLQKIERQEYFDHLYQVCSEPIDILVTHSNPCLPGQEYKVKGEDAPQILDYFQKSSAYLLVHGHMHTEPVVSVLDDGKVVVNSDCRVVAFLPA